MSIFCQNCGNMVQDDNAAFCDKCGKPLKAQPSFPQDEAATVALDNEAPQYQAPAPEQFQQPQSQAPAAPQYEAPQYQPPAAPQYQPPQYQPPRYQAPAAPQYQPPQYQPPQYQAPAAPQYEAPQYQPPGAPQYQPPQYQAPAPQYGGTAVATKKNPLEGILKFVKEKKFIVIGAAALLVAVIVLIIILSSCSGNSPEGALKKLMNSTKNLDAAGICDVAYEANFNPSHSKSEFVESGKSSIEANGFQETYKNMMKDMEVTVKKSEVLSASETDDLKDSWSSSYKDTDKISEIRKLEYVLTSMGSSSENDCYAVKVNGRWYVKDAYSGLSSVSGLDF